MKKISVTSAEQVASIAPEDISKVDFESLLSTFQKSESGGDRRQLFSMLVHKMSSMDRQRTFSIDWLTENLGPPDYYSSEGLDWDLYYILTNREYVALLIVKDGIFQKCVSIDWQQFEAVGLPNLSIWQAAQEEDPTTPPEI